MTGDGRVVTCSRDEHPDLFFGFPNSYGTLGYALRLVIELEPVRPFVALTHERFGSVARAGRPARSRSAATRSADFVDGTWFSPTECYLTLGRWADEAASPPERLHRAADLLPVDPVPQHRRPDRPRLPLALGHRLVLVLAGVRRAAARRCAASSRGGWLRSDTYWKLVAFERKHRWKTRWDRRRGRPEREEVVQDVEVPVGALAEFMDVFAREVPIEPVWFCPLKQRDPAVVWDLYAFDPDELYVNVGFWSSVALEPGEDPTTHDRLVERLVARLGGRKSLYSTSHYSREEFAATYGGAVYEVLKKTWDPDGRLLDLYAKCVERR